MPDELNRICPYCGKKMVMDIYVKMPGIQAIAYCDNEECKVKPCTDASYPSKVYAEILSITGDKK